jgi:hypothetical protein
MLFNAARDGVLVVQMNRTVLAGAAVQHIEETRTVEYTVLAVDDADGVLIIRKPEAKRSAKRKASAKTDSAQSVKVALKRPRHAAAPMQTDSKAELRSRPL